LLENPDSGAETLDSKLTDNQNAFAVYLEDTFDIARHLFGARDSLILTLGVRWDWLRHDIDDQSPTEQDRASASGVSTFNRANPRFGINYNFTPSNGAYFTFGQGFRAPAFLELSCAGPAAVCPGLQAGVAQDPPLSPVRVNNYEVGARLRPWPWLGIEAAMFRADVLDDIFAVSPTGTTGLFFQNVGNTRRQGIELDAQATVARDWDVRLNYTYTQATFRSDLELTTSRLVPGCDEPPCTEPVQKGNSLPLIPRNRLNVSVDYRVMPWLTLRVSGAYVGSQWFRGDEENVEPKLSSYFLMSAGARAHYRALSAFLTINNLLNNKYETFGTFAPNAKVAGAPIEPFLTPAPPINVVGGVSYRF
jgi:iron complex outermembrane receptor protein